MGTPALMQLARTRVREQISNGQSPIVVVSAFFGVTDKLAKFSLTELSAIKEQHCRVLREVGMNTRPALVVLDKLFGALEEDVRQAVATGLDNAKKARILSYGERISAELFALFLQSVGMAARAVDEETLGIVTNDDFLNADIKVEASIEGVRRSLNDQNIVPVVTGFLGRTLRGQTTTLGRGGSDTTACFLGSAFFGASVLLWKDVDGVLTADPKLVAEAKTVPSLSYAEAEKCGKVFCSRAVQYLRRTNTQPLLFLLIIQSDVLSLASSTFVCLCSR